MLLKRAAPHHIGFHVPDVLAAVRRFEELGCGPAVLLEMDIEGRAGDRKLKARFSGWFVRAPGGLLEIMPGELDAPHAAYLVSELDPDDPTFRVVAWAADGELLAAFLDQSATGLSVELVTPALAARVEAAFNARGAGGER